MPILLVTARDSFEAHLIRNELERQGITATVQGETLASGRGDLPMTPQTLPQVWVNEEDLGAARPIAEEILSADADTDFTPADDWRCSACDTEVEGQFAVCWNCGGVRPESNDPPPSDQSTSLDSPEDDTP